MPATTIKLPAELKERIAAVIEGTPKSMHAFMLEAIEQQTILAEQRKAFVESALAARNRALETGMGYAAKDVHRYMSARAQGKRAARPKAKRWRR